MILYYAAGASSQAAHILLREAELPFTLERVDLATHRTSSGDYASINPKLYVPALRRNDGSVLTECAVILQYISDCAPDRALLPPPGDDARYRSLEWLNFIATELHKNFITPERHGGVAANFLSKTAAGQLQTRLHVAPRLSWVNEQLDGQAFLMGDRFTAPDAYLFTMLSWAGRLSIALDQWPHLSRFAARVAKRPAVEAAVAAEGPPHALIEQP